MTIEKSDPFASVPYQVAMDDRLNKTDLRVLISILTFRNKKTGQCNPARSQIAERTGLPLCKISTATTRLELLGWIEKTGNGGRSQSSNYKFTIPNFLEMQAKTVTESVTVNDDNDASADGETVTESVTVTDGENGYRNSNGYQNGNGYRISNETVTESVTKRLPNQEGAKNRQEQTRTDKSIESAQQEPKKTRTKKAGTKNSSGTPSIGDQMAALPNGIAPETAQDFVEHRKAIKAPLTARAFELAMIELAKAGDYGLTAEQVVNTTILNGWKGLNCQWVLNKQCGNAPRNQQTKGDSYVAKLHELHQAAVAAEMGNGPFCQTDGDLRGAIPAPVAGTNNGRHALRVVGGVGRNDG